VISGDICPRAWTGRCQHDAVGPSSLDILHAAAARRESARPRGWQAAHASNARRGWGERCLCPRSSAASERRKWGHVAAGPAASGNSANAKRPADSSAVVACQANRRGQGDTLLRVICSRNGSHACPRRLFVEAKDGDAFQVSARVALLSARGSAGATREELSQPQNPRGFRSWGSRL
jgi:hypothetical protein